VSKDPNNLVWIDLEMTGLYPERDRIIEIATIITDKDLEIIEEGPVFAVIQDDDLLDNMDAWNTKTHNQTGLIDRIRAEGVPEDEAMRESLAFIKQFVPGNRAPLCGNSICQDRRFLYRYMSKLEQYLHYRNLDVSSVKELVKRWRPDLISGFEKKNTHQALDDIRESIAELKYYREHFIIDERPD